MIEPHNDDRLVQKLVERGEALTLAKVVQSTYYCGMNCGLLEGDRSPAWKELFKSLQEAIDRAYPGEVSWDLIYCLKKGDHANETVSPEIKTKYIRIWLLSDKRAAAEIQRGFYKHFGLNPEEQVSNGNTS